MCVSIIYFSFHDDHFVFFFTFHVHFSWSLCITSRYFHSCNSHCNSFMLEKLKCWLHLSEFFESWTFRQSQSQNPNLNWTKIIIILDYYPTLGARLLPQKWFFYQIFKFYYGFLLSEKMIRFHDWYFILLISAKYKKAILKSDYFVK